MQHAMKRESGRTVRAVALLGAVIALGLVVRHGRAQGVTNITDATPITASGQYLVTADISGTIVITASHVDLNLGGHTITTPGPADGIIVQARATDVHIHHGTITHTGLGRNVGIDLRGGGCLVNNVTATGFGTGIALLDGGGDLIIGNVCSNNNDVGIQVGSGSNFISGNVCSNNNDVGIQVGFGAHSNAIKGNRALNNGTDLQDINSDCDSNIWDANIFTTSNPSSCIH